MGKFDVQEPRQTGNISVVLSNSVSSVQPTRFKDYEALQDLEALRIPNYRDCSSPFLEIELPLVRLYLPIPVLTRRRIGDYFLTGVGRAVEMTNRRRGEKSEDVEGTWCLVGWYKHSPAKSPAPLVFYHVLLAMGHRHARPHIAICWFPSRQVENLFLFDGIARTCLYKPLPERLPRPCPSAIPAEQDVEIAAKERGGKRKKKEKEERDIVATARGKTESQSDYFFRRCE